VFNAGAQVIGAHELGVLQTYVLRSVGICGRSVQDRPPLV